MSSPSTILRVLDVQTLSIPRLFLARCETLCGAARPGIALRAPTGLLICPISVQSGAEGEADSMVKLSLPPSKAAEGLRPGDLLKSLS